MESNKDQDASPLEQTEHGPSLTVTRERVDEIMNALVACLPPVDMVNEPKDARDARRARRKAIIDGLTADEYGLFFDSPEEDYVAPRPSGFSKSNE